MRKQVWPWLGIIIALIVFGAGLYLHLTGAVSMQNINEGSPWFWTLLLSAAVVDSINPCAFSILLITIAFLLSMGADRKRVVTIGFIYVLGIFVMYYGIGVALGQTLSFFGAPRFMSKIGAIVMLLAGGIGIAGELIPNFPIKLKIPEISHSRIAVLMHQASVLAAFLLGALVGFSEFPCTGGPYIMIVGLLHDATTRISGLGYLFLYNIIFVLPLVIILALASRPEVLTRIQEWRKSNAGQTRWWASIGALIIGLLLLLL